MLVWRKGNIEKKNCLSVTVLCNYNGAQRYEQFLQVSRLYQALILLGLALCLQSTYIDINFFLLTSFSLHFSDLCLVRLALDLVD